MLSIKNILNERIIVLIIFIVSILINQYSGFRGVFPADSFAFFDSGYRILNSEIPFKDYWLVSGLFIDYFQALLFLIFGFSWESYVLHGSLINGIFVVATYYFFRHCNLGKSYSFIYCLSLSISAYPVSGTPFVEQHATFFSIIGFYCIFYGLNSKKKIYWLLTVFLFGFAFLSKQVPSAYLATSGIIIVIYNFLVIKDKHNYKIIFYVFSYSIFFLVLLFLFFIKSGIDYKDFINQYILYPMSFGVERLGKYEIDLNNFFFQFKFIYLFFIPYSILNLIQLLKDREYYKSKNFNLFLLSLAILSCMIFHQIHTKNQVYIYFMIPIIAGFLHINLKSIQIKSKKFFYYFFIAIIVILTVKYHYRFNIERKFHELNYINFNHALNGNKLDKKFEGLKWITPKSTSKDKNLEELNDILNLKRALTDDKRNKMLISNYSFFSILLKENLHAPNRWYPLDGSAFPIKKSDYYNYYKLFFINIIKRNKIEVIYMSNEINLKTLNYYLDKKCFQTLESNKSYKSYSINKNCKQLNFF